MSTKKSEVELEGVRGGYSHGVLRLVLLSLAIVSIVVGLRSIYRFHMWNW